MAYVRVKKGKQAGEVFDIDAGPLKIGREEDQTVQVTDEGVSRAHAEIFIMGGKAFVKDLRSTNGKFVNGEPVTEEMLQPGDEVKVGETVLIFEGTSR